jgi:NAD(P)-dependent dehydrogenase (short-subunit alcohol dehydrogenase family)
MTTHDTDLQDQKALVTGATSGIGRAIALQFARQGAEVLVHGRDAQRGASVVEAITAAGGKARFVAADLSDPADLQRLVDTIGEVDVLVNNAGFSWFGPTADLDVETFDALFVSNVRAPFFLVAGIAPKMAARGYGCIINVSSMAGQTLRWSDSSPRPGRATSPTRSSQPMAVAQPSKEVSLLCAGVWSLGSDQQVASAPAARSSEWSPCPRRFFRSHVEGRP